MSKRDVAVIAIAMIAVFWFMIAIVGQSLRCYQAGGLPVLSIGHIGCAQPYKGTPA